MKYSSDYLRSLFVCIICLFSVTNLFSDTIAPPSINRNALEERLKRRKLRLDSTLKSTDAFMDSITGKSDGKIDTSLLLYSYEIQKKREAEARVYWWVKVGSLLVLLILGVGFWVWKYRMKK